MFVSLAGGSFCAFLPARHILFKLGGICLFQFLLADSITQKDIIVIHEHIRHFFHKMLPYRCILNSGFVPVSF